MRKRTIFVWMLIALAAGWGSGRLFGLLLVMAGLFAGYVRWMRRFPRRACPSPRCDGGRIRSRIMPWAYYHHRACRGSGRAFRPGARLFAPPRQRIAAQQRPPRRREFVH